MPVFEHAESQGPYVNLFLNRGQFAKIAIEAVNQLGDDYGRTTAYKGRRALIEFPAVNPSKPWHIGHARNAVLGDMLGNVLEIVGYDVARIDYINNLGLQIAQERGSCCMIQRNPQTPTTIIMMKELTT